jgi:hypothetical protein
MLVNAYGYVNTKTVMAFNKGLNDGNRSVAGKLTAEIGGAQPLLAECKTCEA